MERALPARGIIQSVRSGVLPSNAAGEMVEILTHYTCEPMSLSLVHAHGRNVPRHVRVVMSWLTEILKVAQLLNGLHK
jgi:hypothetical protein